MTTSNNNEGKVPTLDTGIKRRMTDAGYFKVDLPKPVRSKLLVKGEGPVDTIELRCQSCYVSHPDTIKPCNSVVKTIVGGGLGDQSEIVECGKCRTSYFIRTQYDKKGHLKLKMRVWNLGRNVRNFTARCEHNNDLDYLIKFNQEKK